jgi:hypothetical protein
MAQTVSIILFDEDRKALEVMVPARVVLGFVDASRVGMMLSDHAARSMIGSPGFSARLCQPSTFRMVI